MKTTISLLIFAVTSFALNVAHASIQDPDTLVRTVVPECEVNICFALQGSKSLTGGQFFSQFRIIRRVVRAISFRNDINVSGVQYGLDNKVISTITSNVQNFLLLLRSTPFVRAPTNFVSGGILFCQGQLRNNEDDAGKIVLLGSGRADFGGDPIPRAQAFLESGGEMLAIGVGEFDRDSLTAIIGGNSSRVFKLGSREQDSDILGPILSAICGQPVTYSQD